MIMSHKKCVFKKIGLINRDNEIHETHSIYHPPFSSVAQKSNKAQSLANHKEGSATRDDNKRCVVFTTIILSLQLL